MRALLFHCKEYGIKIGKMADRPKGIIPEQVQEKEQHCKDCVVALITVEKDDDSEKFASRLSEEISKMCEEVGHKNVVVFPFAHLSNNLAEAKKGIETITRIKNSFEKEYTVMKAHFGSHKELLLNIYGHPGNARYREF